MPIAPPRIAACLIVRDEATKIVACLSSLKDIVDEVIVYDTGSEDDTVWLARSTGATVIEGYWDDDFARARNAAAGEASATWILSVDADEVVGASNGRLCQLLDAAEGVDAFSVEIVQEPGTDGTGGYTSRAVKLFRRAGTSWSGSVHERVLRGGVEVPAQTLDAQVLQFAHSGYSVDSVRWGKARRNAMLGLAELQRLNLSFGKPATEFARVLLDLARSLTGCNQRQDAVDTLVALRGLDLGHGNFYWLQGTELLARLALGSDDIQAAAELVEQLREQDAPIAYCDWLEAQVLAHRGEASRALVLMNGITELVDSAGRCYDRGELLEMRALVAALAGETDQAVDDMAEAMAGFGRVAGRGEAILSWWGERSVERLWSKLATYGLQHLDAISEELAPAESIRLAS